MDKDEVILMDKWQESVNPGTFKSTKSFYHFPCTHRGWKSETHCQYIHGYSREFHFEFACTSFTPEGWVVDFGGLKKVKEWLEYMFDHTFLSSEDDPHLETFKKLEADGLIQLRTMPNIGMEGTAHYVYEKANKMIKEITNGRAWVTKIEVRENDKNSSIYIPNLS